MSLWEKIKKNSIVIIIVSLIVLFFLVYLADMIFITVYPGHAGVLFRRVFYAGTVIDKVFDEGLNVIAPWNKMYLYDVRIKEKKQSVDVLSQNGLTIDVAVSVRYHVSKVQAPVLHKKVGQDYEEKIIIPSIISSVREVVGEYRPEEIYTTARHLIQDKLLVEVIEETGRIPVIYDDVIVENIALPELINNAIEMKLKQQQEYLEYEFRVKKAEREIERAEKEAIGIRQYQKIVTESLSPELLKWKGIMATLELAKSSNTKIIIVGGGENGLPIIFNADATSESSPKNTFSHDSHSLSSISGDQFSGAQNQVAIKATQQPIDVETHQSLDATIQQPLDATIQQPIDIGVVTQQSLNSQNLQSLDGNTKNNIKQKYTNVKANITQQHQVEETK